MALKQLGLDSMIQINNTSIANHCLVTGFIDIEREIWNARFSRPLEFYFQAFENLCRWTTDPIIVFIEPKHEARVLRAIAGRPEVMVCLFDRSELWPFAEARRQKVTALMQSEAFKQSIIAERLDYPEVCNVDYVLATNSKGAFLRRAAELAHAEYLTWVDFGCMRSRTHGPLPGKFFNPSPGFLDHERVRVSADVEGLGDGDLRRLVSTGEVRVRGNLIHAHHPTATILDAAWLREFDAMLSSGLVGDDQDTLAAVMVHQPSLFAPWPIMGDEWFDIMNWVAMPPVRTRMDLAQVFGHYRGTFVEVGVFRGAFSLAMAERTRFSRRVGVDPYEHREGYDDTSNLSQPAFDQMYEETRVMLLAAGIELLRERSMSAADAFEKESIDVVYIDGDHSFGAVLSDLRAWWPKVRPGGLLCGDDLADDPEKPYDASGNQYIEWMAGCGGQYGVDRALREFERLTNVKAQRFKECFQWVMRKPY